MYNKTIELIEEIVRGKEELARTKKLELISKVELCMEGIERRFSIV